MASIYDLSWNNDSFTAKLCLFLKSNWKERKRIKSNDAKIKAQGYSALSSTYYSISATANAKFRAMFKFKPLWLLPIRYSIFILTWMPLGIWCYYRMLYLSNCVKKIIGYENMTAGMCDIRQSILRKRGAYGEARKCIEAGLLKKDIEVYTIGLLNIGLADVFKNFINRKKAKKCFDKALEIAEQVEKTEPQQAVRIYKHCANLTDWLKISGSIPGAEIRKKAEDIGRKIDAKDQILKIKN